MKLIHLSDLHLGRKLEEFSFYEDQVHILQEILKIIQRETPDGVLIAGDIYDRPIPSLEAVTLLNDFLVKLSQEKIPVYLLSGNHDSPERLSFGGKLMEAGQIYISPSYQGKVFPLTLRRGDEEVDIYLLPFIKPAHVRKYFPEQEIEHDTQALTVAIQEMNVDKDRVSILVSHQFVTGSQTCESEELSVGGLDHVEASVFADFDYVALGHLHSPQTVGNGRIRYCGSPLKYSFSEVHHEKSVTVLSWGKDLEEEHSEYSTENSQNSQNSQNFKNSQDFENSKGKETITKIGTGHRAMTLRTVPLLPLRDLVELRGDYFTLSSQDFYQDLNRQDLFRITLTDEEEILDAMALLRTIYPNVLKLRYDNKRTRQDSQVHTLQSVAKKDPLVIFNDLFQEQNGRELSAGEETYLKELITSIWEGTTL